MGISSKSKIDFILHTLWSEFWKLGISSIYYATNHTHKDTLNIAILMYARAYQFTAETMVKTFELLCQHSRRSAQLNDNLLQILIRTRNAMRIYQNTMKRSWKWTENSIQDFM